VTDRSTRAISSQAIGRGLPYRLYGGFLELHRQAPTAATPLAAVELPEIDDGPHFFYGLQWWFFGLLAIGGFVYLVYDEYQQRRTPREAVGPEPGSEAPQQPAVDREHHAGQV
jgi:cytochrome oxidase assembly protein ShyY1